MPKKSTGLRSMTKVYKWEFVAPDLAAFEKGSLTIPASEERCAELAAKWRCRVVAYCEGRYDYHCDSDGSVEMYI